MKTLKWGLLYTAAFLAAFVGSALLKMNSDPTHGKYNTRWESPANGQNSQEVFPA